MYLEKLKQPKNLKPRGILYKRGETCRAMEYLEKLKRPKI